MEQDASVDSLSEKLAALDLSDGERSVLHGLINPSGDEVEGFASHSPPPPEPGGRAYVGWLRDQVKRNIKMAGIEYADPDVEAQTHKRG